MREFDVWPRRVPMLSHCVECGHARLDHPGGGPCDPQRSQCGCKAFIDPPPPAFDHARDDDRLAGR